MWIFVVAFVFCTALLVIEHPHLFHVSLVGMCISMAGILVSVTVSVSSPSLTVPLATSPYSLVERKAVVDVAWKLAAYCHDAKNLDAARRRVLQLGQELKKVYMHPEMTPALSHPDMITAFGVCGRTLDSGMHIATS